MTYSLHGVGVSRGIAIGRVHIIERAELEINEYAIAPDQVAHEIDRLRMAVAQAKEHLRAIREHIPNNTAADISVFIDTHLLMLTDTTLTDGPARIIRERCCNAEWALKLQRDALVTAFDQMDDAYLRTRKDDVEHVVDRVQRLLLRHVLPKHEIPGSRMRGMIVLADDLTPADTVLMRHHGVAAFITEFGGPTSHTSILARSLRIPGIVGLHHAGRYIRQNELLIVVGDQGAVIGEPDERILEHYRTKREEQRRYYASLITLKDTAAVTADGQAVVLEANIELPGDFDEVVNVGASAVGLYRSEFMFMNRKDLPDEEEHFEAYLQLIDALGGIPVTIRTLDLGADKQVDGGRISGPVGTNPALGLRAVRLCLKEPALFWPQLRAIIRVSAVGPVRLMVPMLSTLDEIQQVLDIIRAIQTDFSRKGVAFDQNMPIGGMIEVPAAAICAYAFAQRLDFLSIGTNDLIQYTLAIDRVNDEVNYLYDPLNPAVLKLIVSVISAGEKAGIPVSMCGEMAGDTRYTRLLLGLGLKTFSVHPSALLEVKRVITQSRVSDMRDIVERTLEITDPVELQVVLENIL